jgi:uncharacterized damage-inducible protein DinB
METLPKSVGIIPADASYLAPFLKAAPTGPLSEALEAHFQAVIAQISQLPESCAPFAYAAEKWTVRQLIGHILDAHTIFTYRAMCLTRGETKALPGFDENAYAAYWLSAPISLAQMAVTYASMSQATLASIRLMSDSALQIPGIANGIGITANQVMRVLISHERHHLRMLGERYGMGN